jgi:hypothetical protein
LTSFFGAFFTNSCPLGNVSSETPNFPMLIENQ